MLLDFQKLELNQWGFVDCRRHATLEKQLDNLTSRFTKDSFPHLIMHIIYVSLSNRNNLQLYRTRWRLTYINGSRDYCKVCIGKSLCGHHLFSDICMNRQRSPFRIEVNGVLFIAEGIIDQKIAWQTMLDWAKQGEDYLHWLVCIWKFHCFLLFFSDISMNVQLRWVKPCLGKSHGHHIFILIST